MMSDHSEVLYDPSLHTHTSCLRDVQGADIVVLLIGSRFGGTTVSQALPLIDFDFATKSSSSIALLSEPHKISITQAEAIQAAANDIPIFTFVDSKVYADHHIYQANKNNPSLKDIKFPSIIDQKHSKNIFEFINFLSHRSFNNSIITFQSFSEIEEHLLKQWSLLFQRLLQERKDRTVDNKKSSDIVGRIDELKSAILQAMPKGMERDLVRSTVKYRRMVEFLVQLKSATNNNDFVDFKGSYGDLLSHYDVEDVIWDNAPSSPYYAICILKSGGFVGCFSYTDDEVLGFESDWISFSNLSDSLRHSTVEAVIDIMDSGRAFEKRSVSFAEYHDELAAAEKDNENRKRPR